MVPIRLMMPTDLPIRCFCGALRGVASGVSSDRGNRVVCYCDDCQSFAHFLGRADTVLDTHGGTDIFQMSPARLQITEGAEHLACMRLTPKGLLRWYAACCQTPIGNTLPTRHVPFVGLIHSCMDHAADDRSRDATLGPVRARVHGRFAKGDRTELVAHEWAPVSMLMRFAGVLLMARLRGDHKTSPFFNPRTNEPSATPRILSDDELHEVESARDER